MGLTALLSISRSDEIVVGQCAIEAGQPKQGVSLSLKEKELRRIIRDRLMGRSVFTDTNRIMSGDADRTKLL